MKEQSIRAFCAIELTDKIALKNIENLQIRLEGIIKSIKMVELENLHITMRFLGNISLEMAKELYFFIEQQINIPYFKGENLNFDIIRLRDFNKRVFYVDLNGPTQILSEINKKIEDHLENLYQFEKSSNFHTHITIGRLKRKKKYRQNGENKNNFDKNQYSKLKEEYDRIILGYLKVSKVVLKKSILTPKGPIYENMVF